MSAPKVRLGIGDNVLDLLSIGNVSRIVQHPIKTVSRRKIAGGEVLLPELEAAETLYILEGYIDQEAEANLTGFDDINGKFAINKARLKIEVHYEKEETTLIE